VGSRFESWWVHKASDSLGAHSLIVVVPCSVPDVDPFDRMDLS
jgi:hypothetical protein